MLLEVKDLHVKYGNVEALKGVSMQVEEGRIACLIGANGAGKTTLLWTVSGLKTPVSGHVLYKGDRIDGTSPDKLTRLGIAHVPEGRRLFGKMSVLDNLMMGAYIQSNQAIIRKNLQEVYERFPILSDRKGQRAATLSGGEQQMLAIGRALMMNPTLLLLDEPSIGLAPMMVQEIAHIVRDINSGGISIILVEQNASMALSLSHWAYVVTTGKIVLNGDARQLKQSEQVRKAYLGE